MRYWLLCRCFENLEIRLLLIAMYVGGTLFVPFSAFVLHQLKEKRKKSSSLISEGQIWGKCLVMVSGNEGNAYCTIKTLEVN